MVDKRVISDCIRTVKNENGSSALHTAVYGAAGTSPANTQNTEGLGLLSILHWAVLHNKVDVFKEVQLYVLRQLLRQTNRSNGTPLHLADNSTLESLMWVADLGGDEVKSILAGEKDKERTLHIASEIGCDRLVEILLENSTSVATDIMKPDHMFLGNTAVHAAAIGGNIQVVKRLVEALGPDGHELNGCVNWYGQTPLHFAVAEDKYEVAEFLIKEKRCDPAQPDRAGATPLHFAARGASEKVLELLKNSLGASSVNQKTHAGLTPLHYAAWNGNGAAIRWLTALDVRLDLRAIDRVEKLTPCMWGALGCCTGDGRDTRPFLKLLDVYIHRGINPLEKNPELFCGEVFPVSRPSDVTNQLCYRLLSKAEIPLSAALISCSVAYGDTTTLQVLAHRIRARRTVKPNKYDPVKKAQSVQLAVRCLRHDPTVFSEAFEILWEEITKEPDFHTRNDLESAFLQIPLSKTSDKLINLLVNHREPVQVCELLQQRLYRMLSLDSDPESLLQLKKQHQFNNVHELVNDIPLAYWVHQMEKTISCDVTDRKDERSTEKETVDISEVKRICGSDDRYPNNTGRYTGRTALHWAVIFGDIDAVRALCKDERCKKDIQDHFGRSPHWYSTEHKKTFSSQEYTEFVNYLKGARYYESLYKDRDIHVDALNAILVGAALIATVTFAGLLTPPLEYPVQSSNRTPNLKYAAVYKPGVQVFWVCNSLAFFSSMASALAGITGVLPEAPVLDANEVKRIRGLLLTSASFFVISIVFVLFAFTAAGFSDIPGRLKLQANMIITTSLGGVFCMYRLVNFGRVVYHLSPNYTLKIRKEIENRLGPVFRKVNILNNAKERLVGCLNCNFRAPPKDNAKVEMAPINPQLGFMSDKYKRGSQRAKILKSGFFSAKRYSWDDGLWNDPLAKLTRHRL